MVTETNRDTRTVNTGRERCGEVGPGVGEREDRKKAGSEKEN